MIESNVITKNLKKNIIHNDNYLINQKYNVIVKIYMDKLLGFKKKKYICFIYIKFLNNHLTNNFKISREKILTSLTNKIEKKFV